ncbi:nuclear transport factor 2 family protein [Streptomyces sp. NPDC050121]|uniref:nuclear transport factor 2 family protein n=1 Tax=Streptomyces sp. NPDC050121 TaxID=3365601 RepID=UPI0037B23A85
MPRPSGRGGIGLLRSRAGKAESPSGRFGVSRGGVALDLEPVDDLGVEGPASGLSSRPCATSLSTAPTTAATPSRTPSSPRYRTGKLLPGQEVHSAKQFSGEHKGQGAVFQMLGRMMEASQGTFAIDTVHTLMANGDLVTATIRFSGRRDDASMTMDGVDLLRIADGKITEMWLFSEDPATEDAFWG